MDPASPQPAGTGRLPAAPQLHLVTDERLGAERLAEVVDAAVRGGVDVVQVRDKRASAAELVGQVCALSEVVAGRAALLVNDRVDVVLAARWLGARVDGVHLGQKDLDPRVARDVLGPSAVVGWTANRPEHLRVLRAMAPGVVDYLGVGTLRATSTKSDHPPPRGVEGLGALARGTAVPCVAIGGVLPEDVPALLAAGLAGVAVVSAICGDPDPGAAAGAFAGRLAGAGVVGAGR